MRGAPSPHRSTVSAQRSLGGCVELHGVLAQFYLSPIDGRVRLDLPPNVAAAASRGAAELRAGGTVDEVLRGFREVDRLGDLESILALRAIALISLSAS